MALVNPYKPLLIQASFLFDDFLNQEMSRKEMR